MMRVKTHNEIFILLINDAVNCALLNSHITFMHLKASRVNNSRTCVYIMCVKQCESTMKKLAFTPSINQSNKFEQKDTQVKQTKQISSAHDISFSMQADTQVNTSMTM